MTIDTDGRIYIVDVNKTDTGPVTSRPFCQKLASIAFLADALLALRNQSSSKKVEIARLKATLEPSDAANYRRFPYSHSIVPGGLLV